MKYTQVPSDLFKKIQINAGIIVSAFEPETGAITATRFIAIKIMNALSTGGFKIKSDDKSKGNFDFEYTGHYSIKNAETVPYEVYIKTGEAA